MKSNPDIVKSLLLAVTGIYVSSYIIDTIIIILSYF
jgi:hypothetical protein